MAIALCILSFSRVSDPCGWGLTVSPFFCQTCTEMADRLIPSLWLGDGKTFEKAGRPGVIAGSGLFIKPASNTLFPLTNHGLIFYALLDWNGVRRFTCSIDI